MARSTRKPERRRRGSWPVHPPRSARALGLAGALLAAVAPPAGATTIDATWTGGSGSWSEAARWSPAGAPDNAGGDRYRAHVDGGLAAVSSSVRVASPVTVDGLDIDAGDEVAIAPGATLTLDASAGTPGAGLHGDGTLRVESASTLPSGRLVLQGPQTLDGAGEIALERGFSAPSPIVEISGATPGEVVHGPGRVLRGDGSVLGGFTNQGVLRAGGPGLANPFPRLAVRGVVSTGALEAAGQGGSQAVLDFSDGVIDDGSLISTAAGSIVQAAGSTVRGTVTVDGAGRFELRDATLDGATLAGGGTTRIPFGAGSSAIGDLSHDGTFEMLGGLALEPGATLGGPGTFEVGSSWQPVAGGGAPMVNAAGHTIEGTGSSATLVGPLVNEGTITGGLRIAPGAGGFVNRGTLRPTGAMALGNGVHTFEPGSVIDLGARPLDVRDDAAVGGVLTLTGAEALQVSDGTLDGAHLAAGTVQAVGSARIEHGLTNDGRVRVTQKLEAIGAAQVFGGPGEIELSGGLFEVGEDAAVTQAAGHTIRGHGTLAVRDAVANAAPAPTAGRFFNEGTIESDLPPLTSDPTPFSLTVDLANARFENRGMIRAPAGKPAIRITHPLDQASGTSSVFTQSAGVLAVDSSLVSEIPIDVTGGEVTGSGAIEAPLLQLGGTSRLRPGSSPGILNVLGDLALLAGAALEIEIGGPDPGTDLDLLLVSGEASLAGDLAISLVGGFVPRIGDVFTFLQAGSVSGSFASGPVSALTGGWRVDFGVRQDSTRVWVEVLGLASPASVPEPAADLLLATGLLALARRRPRRAAARRVGA